MGEKIACLFLGVGYTCDKPLLYYSAKLLKGMGRGYHRGPLGGYEGDPVMLQKTEDIAV